MKQLKRPWLVVLVIASVALVALGGAYAAAGKSNGNGSNAPQAGAVDSPAIVAASVAGMPVTAQVLYATVNADGTLARGLPRAGAQAPVSSKVATGAYQVLFFHDMTGCAYTASIGNAGAGNPTHGTIVVAARIGQANGVFVETRNVDGTLADHPFHLIVSC